MRYLVVVEKGSTSFGLTSPIFPAALQSGKHETKCLHPFMKRLSSTWKDSRKMGNPFLRRHPPAN